MRFVIPDLKRHPKWTGTWRVCSQQIDIVQLVKIPNFMVNYNGRFSLCLWINFRDAKTWKLAGLRSSVKCCSESMHVSIWRTTRSSLRSMMSSVIPWRTQTTRRIWNTGRTTTAMVCQRCGRNLRYVWPVSTLTRLTTGQARFCWFCSRGL